MKRIIEKITEIRKYISEFEEILPEYFEEYSKDNIIKAACERYVERIIEGATDISFLFIKYKKYDIPEDDIDAFRILNSNSVISEELYKKLKEAKGMRNIIVHQYGRVDDEVIFEAINNQLCKDISEFLKVISKKVK